MTVYFVRHGESEWSAQGRHQDASSPLSDEGRKQAELLRERFGNIKVDRMLTSPFVRAKQTAEIINQKLEVPMEVSELLVEVKRPTEVEGKEKQSEEVKRIRKLLDENYHNAGWRYSDEETFDEFKQRGLKAKILLENLSERSVLVVSHGLLVKMVVAMMLFGEGLSSGEWVKFYKFFRMDNTGITVCEKRDDDSWKLLTWNDYAHLG